ncbi:HD-GYP domain-containing protein [Pseudodesulfovibrio piezophilus]|uniref:Putative metal dependent phosphohydrolase n=1 Tax=Pseudodesulfovibrio piezophilus (strain DSM 21447 / JCM 15486 / C1TLV30) TaxID=1322246 RepID=M1WX72_PSEP2|nr:HD domain-containing phosphohydrolase [Pseudodesulfovibrio piezophilus]CCH49558.1 putative metal dependent phosphohydrolase [Pseudodesulfovibrio piezophilus C1TLV30]
MADVENNTKSSRDNDPDNLSTEDYNQIDPHILECFPPVRYPVDLYEFRESAGLLSRIYTAGEDVSGAQRERFRELSEDGDLFFSRKQISQYSATVATNIKMALKDPNLAWEEKSSILIGELKIRQDDLFDHPMPRELKALTQTLETLCSYLSRSPSHIMKIVQHIHADLSPPRRRVNASLMALAVYTKLHREDLHSKTLNAVALGFFLYDIGMTKISHLMLGRKQKLTPMEQRTMRGHPGKSDTILTRLSLIQPEIREPALQHHERLNGSGYPNKLKGNAISQLGRIVAVTDTYSAMITDTPQRRGFSTAEAAAELLNREELYDPVICRTLVRFLQTIPS